MVEINRPDFDMFQWFQTAKKYYEELPSEDNLGKIDLEELIIIRGVIEDRLDFMNNHNEKDNELLDNFKEYHLVINKLIYNKIEGNKE